MKLTQVTESAASQAHKLYFIDLFRDVAKIMFYIGRKKSLTKIMFYIGRNKSLISISFVRQ